jgi:hypothetical protein
MVKGEIIMNIFFDTRSPICLSEFLSGVTIQLVELDPETVTDYRFNVEGYKIVKLFRDIYGKNESVLLLVQHPEEGDFCMIQMDAKYLTLHSEIGTKVFVEVTKERLLSFDLGKEWDGVV